MNIFQKQTLTWGAIGFIAFTFVANSVKADTTVQDHNKTVIKRTPFNVEVCSEVDVQGDKTKDTLLGAIIGGAIGQNITKDLPDGATAGAIIGGILGNQNSTVGGSQWKLCILIQPSHLSMRVNNINLISKSNK